MSYWKKAVDGGGREVTAIRRAARQCRIFVGPGSVGRDRADAAPRRTAAMITETVVADRGHG